MATLRRWLRTEAGRELATRAFEIVDRGCGLLDRRGRGYYFAETKFDIERIERRCIERQKAKGADIAKCTSKAEGDLFFAWDVGGTPATPLELVRDWGSWALLPPFGLLLAGLAVTWIVAGFARDRRDKEAG